MTKKILLVLIIVAIFTGAGFAQDFQSMPKNTITVDFGPTIIGLGIASAGSSMGGSDNGLSTTGFGIAAQYERQLLEKMSVGGRFAYLGTGIGMGDKDENYALNISSFSIEGHIRFYPGGGAFFLDGMLGYANLAIGFDGTMKIEERGREKTESVSFSVPRDYFKLGAKIGWRIDFGDAGGFIFEPSFGWYTGVGLGDTIGTGLVNTINKKYNGDLDKETAKSLDDTIAILEDYIFIGGPRFCLSFGWRF
jgi:hypothetical protein